MKKILEMIFMKIWTLRIYQKCQKNFQKRWWTDGNHHKQILINMFWMKSWEIKLLNIFRQIIKIYFSKEIVKVSYLFFIYNISFVVINLDLGAITRKNAHMSV